MQSTTAETRVQLNFKDWHASTRATADRPPLSPEESQRPFARYYDATVLAVLRRLSLVSTWCFQLDRYFVDPDRHVLIPNLQSIKVAENLIAHIVMPD